MNTQKISKKDLQVIYSKVCDGWKKTIAELVMFQDGVIIEVDNDLICKAYKEADASQKKLLEKHFKIISNDIRDRIKTIDDVLCAIGKPMEEVVPYSKPKNKAQKSQNAFALIQCISEVLNEGWIPDFKNTNQYKYYPYFEKKSHGWSLGSCGFVCYYGGLAAYGFWCFYKSSELAVYAGTQFLDVYKEYLPE